MSQKHGFAGIFYKPISFRPNYLTKLYPQNKTTRSKTKKVN